MVWQRMIQRLTGRNRRAVEERSRRRTLKLETLTKRQLLASDIGAVTGVAYTDLTGNGLTADDPRLEGVTVELYSDTNANNTYDAGVDTLVDTDTTDTAVDPVPGQYRFDDLAAGTYFVVQASAGASITAPNASMVTVTADDADGDTIVTIDDFTTGAQLIAATGGATELGSQSAANALGGSRDVELIHTNGSGNTTFQVDNGTELLSLSTGGGATSQATVEYDGADATFGLNVPPGFSPIASLAGGTAGGAVPTNTGIEILGRAENQPETMTVIVFSSATEASEIDITIPQDPTLQTVFVDFTDVGWGTSGFAGVTNPADFNSVIAIRATATVTLADNDIFFSVVESRGPDPIEVNLSNTQLLQLGGTVFEDLGGGADSNNGTLDGTESGLAGITVDLYEEPGGGGAIDPSTQVAVATTTTDGSGNYVFTDLDAGNYLVVIPDGQFAGGQPLFGYATSTGNDPAPDPDDDVDSDDNGSLSAGVGIVTQEITLVAGSEPNNDGDTDVNTNFTLDIGVTPTIDLEITKTLDAAASTLNAGGQAFFDITFTNNGPLDATNVVISDSIPAGMTIDQASSNFGTYTPTIVGQDITVPIGALAVSASDTIRIAVDIDAGQTAPLTNTATIAGDQVETDDSNNSDSAVATLDIADLSITKSDNTASSVVAGEQFTYTITVTNDGPDTATGIVVTDNLPSDLSYVSGSFTTGSGTITETPASSGQLTINVDDLADQASAVIDIVVMVASDAGASIVNTATVVGAPDIDPDDSDNTATETTPVVRNVDVGVTKTTADTAVAGSSITYTFTVTNDGPGDARGVTVTDTLDTALTFSSFDAGTSGVTINQNGQDLTFDVGTLTDGQSETFTITVDIASSATGTLNNQADITTTDTDIDSSNDSDDIDVTVNRTTDLILTKSVDLATATPGDDTLTYSFEIEHDTDSISDSGVVTFTDVLPAGLTLGQISAPNATSQGYDSGSRTITIVFDPIAIGSTETFTFTATVDEDATGTIDNSGSISVTGGDIDSSNDTDNAQTALSPEFDVTLTKTADDTAPASGTNVTYTIELTNDGPSTATGVVLTDDIPAGMTFVSGTLDGQAATSDGTTVTFPAITLDDDETISATLVFTVDASANGTITNTASVAADTGETDTSNNTASEDITATPQADLEVTKSVDLSTAQAGDTLVYTITVTNSGVSPAENVTAEDTLPTGLTFVSANTPGGETVTNNGQDVTVDIGDIAASGSFTFTINATVDAAAPSSVTNSVSVETTTGETDLTNNSATAATTIEAFQSSISGVVYVDTNNNGVQDSGEAGISGVTITLTGTDVFNQPVSRVVTTNDDGEYLFSQLGAGTYDLTQTQPEDYVDGQETAGTGATATINQNAFNDLTFDDSPGTASGFNFGEVAAVLSKRRFLASS
ncbi:SdrD B-like domain-containing protein [Roseiconus lacunae]|uniref:beta strand repeat-containing protein n=1 Tax=Roseiconus lacunae TaxID=2605694 RepID=UPI0030914F2C|nr:SdrD B-like domain-containing protein [Stieleria sp. HD01]